jgi:methionyl-tRNA synthetase
MARNFNGVLPASARAAPVNDHAGAVDQVRSHVEACRFNQALEVIWRQILDPANQYADQQAPWKLVKTDPAAAARVLFELLEPLRCATILLKPFIPRSAAAIYTSFGFTKPWSQVSFADARRPAGDSGDLRLLAQLEGGKVKPLFPRIA